MSREDENLDELFRNADRGNIPPFDDAYWNEMEEMLFDNGAGVDELFTGAAIAAPPYKEVYWREMEALLPEKKRRVAFWWWYAAAGCILLAIGFSWYQLSSNSGSGFSKNNTSASDVKTQKRTASAARSFENQASSPVPFDWIMSFPDKEKIGTITVACENCRDCIAEPFEEKPVISSDVDKLPILETGVSYSMALAKFDVPSEDPLQKRFYVQAGAGIGQSYMQTEKSGFTHFYTIGAGLYQHSGDFTVTFGLQGKIGFINNIQSTQQSGDQTQYRQLYSIETPLTIGWRKGASTFGVGLTPGIQAGYSGMYLTYDAAGAEDSRSRVSGKVPAESTLTMQFGLNFARDLSENWMLGGQVNTDILSPYGNGAFDGKVRKLPVNGCIFLRRSF